jgi:integrase
VFDELWPKRKYGVMALLAATTGMRGQEVRAIHWEGLHFELRGVEIVQALADKGRLPDQVKKNEVRAILFPKRTETYLKDWQNRCSKGPRLPMVFSGKHGVYMDRSAPNKHLKDACRRLGIDSASRNITFHSLRHSFNQRMLLLTRGRYHDDHGNFRPDRPHTSDEVVRMFTGHRSGQMTRLYSNPALLDNLRVMQPMVEMVDKFFDISVGR